jgi:NADPH-dependent 2,4-dienoyl-CoA reductase/sulfur reductase-like enzyme/nitrite reductase/ring-hydroxylating ferredoxin subunit
MGSQAELSGPDLGVGVADGDVKEGRPLLGHAQGEAIVVVREGGRLHALGATCSHYGGPLAEGLVAEGAIHCPWHHACFDLATGRAHGPALAAIACYDVETRDGRIRVGPRREPARATLEGPARVVIVGGGAAGVACAEELRTRGHRGSITLVSGEGSDPVDRPNLSKDYLAGAAPEEWVFLRSQAALAEHDISLVRERVTGIDRGAHTLRTDAGRELGWDALLLATGAEPRRLDLPGAQLPHVHTLRSLADSKAIIEAAGQDRSAVIIGSSFIGLEVAASLVTRGVKVTVVSPDQVPLAKVLGEQVGSFIQGLHTARGVTFRLGRRPARISASEVILDDGTQLPATLVVMGVGVVPRLELATAAGLDVDRGVMVDSELRAAPGIWAAGDIARFTWGGARVRIEHWQVAVRQGQAAARSMLGLGASRDVPFFWSAHHYVTFGYVGHAEGFAAAEIHGSLEARDAHVVYRDGGGKICAVLTLGRDQLGHELEAAMVRDDVAALERLVAG